MSPSRSACVLAIACALPLACSTPPGPDDSGADVVDVGTPDVVVDAPDPHDGLRLPPCETSEPSGDPMIAPVASTLVGTIVPMATRVVADPSMDPVHEAAEVAYRARGFDQYARGPGQARVRRTELGGDTTTGTTRHSIAYFVQSSDYQFADDESPTRFMLADSPGATSGAERPQEAYVARYVSAMHRTLASLIEGQRAYQFGVFAGDCADSSQYNELDWFMHLMNGDGTLETDSGDDNDPVPGPDNDPKDPFDPIGFPAPWYFVPGNHDVEVQGNYVPDDTRRASALSTMAPLGTRDYTTWYAEMTRTRVPADPDRRLLGRADIVAQLQTGAATPGPVGHGYRASSDVTHGAHYTSDVIPGLLRLIALDTSDDTGGSQGMMRQAVVDSFLRPALEQAQHDGVLVMLASHHPTDSIDQLSGEAGNPVADTLSSANIEQLVAQYPNVVLWLVGHQHDIRVRPVRGADSAHPGYWEVQSGSIADWPGQARIVELVDNGNGTLSIFGTLIDAELQTCMERRFRRLQLMDGLSGFEPDHTGTDGDRNVELVIPVPSVAAAAVATASAAAPTRIESETTLRGVH